MPFPIVDLIKGIFTPAAELIDNLHTSAEERGALKNAQMEIELQTALHFLDYEKQLLTAQSSIVMAEAQGGSLIQRIWRPITMLTFLFLVCLDAFGWLPFRLAGEAWMLLQLGLGGYVAGRSGEKIAAIMKRGKDENRNAEEG